MAHKKNTIIATVFICLFIQSYSQKILGGSSKIDGIPVGVSSKSVGPFAYDDDFKTYKKYALIFNDSTAIYLTTEGLIKIDQNMHVLWKDEDLKDINSLAKLNGQILVSQKLNDKKRKGNNDAFEVLLIDNATGKTIKEKTVLENSENNIGITGFICTDNENNFQFILMRKFAIRSKNKSQLQSEFEINLDDSLNITQQIPVETNLSNAGYSPVATYLNSSGTLFEISRNDKTIVVEKFDRGQNKNLKRLSFTIDIGNEWIAWIDNSEVGGNIDNPDELAIALKYQDQKKAYKLQLVKLDFGKNEIKTYEEKLDKDFQARIGSKNAQDFTPIGIEFYKDQIVLLQEFIGDFGDISHQYYETGSIIVSVFNKDLQSVFETKIKKGFASFFPMCRKDTYKFLNNRLILLANTQASSTSYSAWYDEINMDNFSVAEPVMIPKTFVEDGILIQAPATLWFINTALLQYYTGNGKNNHDVVMQKIEF